MASGVYSTAVKAFLDGDIDLLSDTIKATLVDAADYTVDLTAHNFMDDVPSGARATNGTGTLASKTTTISTNVVTFDAADLTLTSVSGDQSEAVVIWKDAGGADSANPVIAYLELSSAVQPNGGNIVLQWNASGLFTATR
jgi:hypothetical protein